MKKIVFALLCLVFCSAIQGQSISRRVVASCGTSATANGLTLHYTVGDLVVTNVVSSGTPSYRLSQGFQQSDTASGSIGIKSVVASADNSVSLSPNPANQIVKISTFTEMPGILSYTIRNSLGQICSKQTSEITLGGLHEQIIDLSPLAMGSYWVEVASVQAETYFLKNLPLIVIK